MATSTTNEELKQDEIGRLISADKVEGTAVHNAAGERLGTIDNIMIDKARAARLASAWVVRAIGR